MSQRIKKDKTLIVGTILISSIEQLNLLGDVGKELILKFNKNKIDPQKYYPRYLRGKIHQEVLYRFGAKALYYLGIEQFNIQKLEDSSAFGKYFYSTKYKYNFKNFDNIKSGKKRNISDQRVVRKRFFDVLSNMHCSKLPIIAENDKISGKYKTVDEDTIHYEITNAVFKGHHEFNRGSLYNWIVRFLGDQWKINITSLEKNFEYRKGLTKNVFKVEFKFRNKKISREDIHLTIRNEAKDEFMKSVLNGSEKQRKLAYSQSLKLEKLSQQLAKYIPPQIHEGLLQGNYDTTITTKRKKLTIFFSDIQNFTSTSEGLQPEDLTKYLNEYFSEMTQIAVDHGATIDKYIGDSVMLFFGDPLSKGEKEDARACVKMSLRMQERMIELRNKWKNEGFSNPFKIRIGINTGYCNVGNFGSDQRLTYTIIGGEVNVAARLESAGTAGKILMSYETYAHVQDMIEVEEKEAIKMKGISREVKVFEIKGIKEFNDQKLEKLKPSKNKSLLIKRVSKKIYQLENQIKDMKNMLNNLEKN